MLILPEQHESRPRPPQPLENIPHGRFPTIATRHGKIASASGHHTRAAQAVFPAESRVQGRVVVDLPLPLVPRVGVPDLEGEVLDRVGALLVVEAVQGVLCGDDERQGFDVGHVRLDVGQSAIEPERVDVVDGLLS